MRRLPVLIPALLIAACGPLKGSDPVIPSPPPVSSPGPQALMPGQQASLSLQFSSPSVTPKMTLSNPAPHLFEASFASDSRHIVITVKDNALPQGPVPLIVTYEADGRQGTVRIPVTIGRRVQNEFDRFNAIRAQAGLGPAAFDWEMGMNCWMHGIYRAAGGPRGHTQDPALPGYSEAGRECAESSNLSMDYLASRQDETPETVEGLFAAPFHALGMLRAQQKVVGIGVYVADEGGQTPITYSGVHSRGDRGTQPVYFPGDGHTTDLSRYSLNEWPNPLTSCPADFTPEHTGLPLIYMSNRNEDTTAANAMLKAGARNVPVCAYGSTQYVNTVDQPLPYANGIKTAEEIGRNAMRSAGAVFVIPKEPLQPATQYSVSLLVNGQPVAWTFSTNSVMAPTSLGDLTQDKGGAVY